MMIGQKIESYEEKTERHLREVLIDKKGWENELDHAIKKGYKTHRDYCVLMIKICENTILNFKKTS